MKTISKADFYNSQYNNRELIPNFPEYIEEMKTLSNKARKELNVKLSIPYGDFKTQDLDQTFDLFPAKKKGKKAKSPLLIFIHGGYWRSLDKADHSFVAPVFVKENIAVAVPNYSLCPKVTIEEIVMQMLSLIKHLYLNADELGFDKNKIYISGHSAGGHLVTQLMCALWPIYDKRLPINLIKGGLSLSGIHDMQMMMEAPFLQQDLHLTKEAVAKLSTAYMRPNLNARLIAAVGGDESAEFIRQTQLIADAWPKQLEKMMILLDKNHLSAVLELTNKKSPLVKSLLKLIKGEKRKS